MNAIVINRYGSPEVLEQRKISTPLVEPGEVLVKVAASSINPIDFKARQGALKLVLRKRFPLVLGHDLAGEVVGLGSGSKLFKIGQQVYGMNSFPRMGAYAGYAAVPEKYLAPAPEKLSLEAAAAVPLAALTALQGLRDFGKLKKNQEVLINGASGGVGSFAVQIAKIMGATVTGVCSGKNIETVRSLGADAVIDYKIQQFEDLPTRYDLVFDAVGKSSFQRSRKVLKNKGNYVSTLPSPANFLWTGLSLLTPRSAKTMWVKANTEDLEILKGYIDTDSLRPLIEKSYTYQDLAEAMRHAESERTIGKLVIKMDFPDGDQG
jgi:NADPH:quinone reductase-like Zn-dependent oxidoreductase